MPVIDAWLIISSQWRAIALGDGRVLWLGLDYGGVAAGLAAAGVALSAGQWTGVRLMESVASAVLNGQRG